MKWHRHDDCPHVIWQSWLLLNSHSVGFTTKLFSLLNYKWIQLTFVAPQSKPDGRCENQIANLLKVKSLNITLTLILVVLYLCPGSDFPMFGLIFVLTRSRFYTLLQHRVRILCVNERSQVLALKYVGKYFFKKMSLNFLSREQLI